MNAQEPPHNQIDAETRPANQEEMYVLHSKKPYGLVNISTPEKLLSPMMEVNSILFGLHLLDGSVKNSTSMLDLLHLQNPVLVNSHTTSILPKMLLLHNLPFHTLLELLVVLLCMLHSMLLSQMLELLVYPLILVLEVKKPLGWTVMMLLLDGINGVTTITSLYVVALDSLMSLTSLVILLSVLLLPPYLAKPL